MYRKWIVLCTLLLPLHALHLTLPNDVAGGAAPMQRGASMTTSEHIDPSIAPANLDDMEDSDQGDIPEGVVRFDITAEEIADAIAAESLEVRTVYILFLLELLKICMSPIVPLSACVPYTLNA